MAEFPDTTWAIPFALKERLYSGSLNGQVTVREASESRPLDSRTDLHNHATTFEWGRDSAGAAQLSLALLADALGNDIAPNFFIRNSRAELLSICPTDGQ